MASKFDGLVEHLTELKLRLVEAKIGEPNKRGIAVFSAQDVAAILGAETSNYVIGPELERIANRTGT